VALAKYTIEIPDGTERSALSIQTTQMHPSPDPDSFQATLDWVEGISLGDTVTIRRDGGKYFGGYVEETREGYDSELGRTLLVSGRCYKRNVWKRHIERFIAIPDIYKGELVKLFLRPVKGGTVEPYHRIEWGLNRTDWSVSASGTKTPPAIGGYEPENAVNGLNTSSWVCDVNQTANEYYEIDLGSDKTVCGIMIECRDPNQTGHYARNFEILADNAAAGSPPVTQVYSRNNNACNNIIASWTPVSVRYIRINLTNSYADEWAISEVFVFESGTALTGLSIGTIDDLAITSAQWERFEFSYQRINECSQDVADASIAVPCEWWIDEDGAVQLQTRRGSDLSGSISFVTGDEIGKLINKESIVELGNRIKVLGKGQDHEQDMVSSDWNEDAASIASYTEYERVFTAKKCEYVDDAELVADLYLDISKDLEQTVRVTIDKDPYATGSWGVGDDVTVTEIHTGVSGSFRVKQLIRKWDSGGETVIIECGVAWRGIQDSLAYLENAIREIVSMREMKGGYVAKEVIQDEETYSAQTDCTCDLVTCNCLLPDYDVLRTLTWSAEEYTRNVITRIQFEAWTTVIPNLGYIRVEFRLGGAGAWKLVRKVAVNSAAWETVDFPTLIGCAENQQLELRFTGCNTAVGADINIRNIVATYNRCTR